eukprot:scaffold13812_cov66-Cylindrotheca_fusiformis.AAC.1
MYKRRQQHPGPWTLACRVRVVDHCRMQYVHGPYPDTEEDDELHCNARGVEGHRRNSGPYSPANRPLVQFIASLPPHPVGAKVVDPSISHHIDYKNHPPLRQDRLIEGEIKSNAATSTDGGSNRCQGKQGDYVAIKRHVAKKRQRPSQHRHDTNGFLNGPAPEEPPTAS